MITLANLHVERLVVLKSGKPCDAEILVLVEEPLNADLLWLFVLLLRGLLPLVELDIVA
jgi:hypothetical protein